MLYLTCQNCAAVIYRGDMHQCAEDVASVNAACRACGAVFRVTVILLREGKHIDRSHLATINGKTRKQLAEDAVRPGTVVDADVPDKPSDV